MKFLFKQAATFAAQPKRKFFSRGVHEVSDEIAKDSYFKTLQKVGLIVTPPGAVGTSNLLEQQKKVVETVKAEAAEKAEASVDEDNSSKKKGKR